VERDLEMAGNDGGAQVRDGREVLARSCSSRAFLAICSLALWVRGVDAFGTPSSKRARTSQGLAFPMLLSELRQSDDARRRELILRRLGIASVHALALLAFFPYFFTWAGVACAIAGFFLIAMTGINLGFHRLLAHKSVSCAKPLERILTTLGTLNLQSGPAFWVGLHRRHHSMADKPGDPHSPRMGFMRAHMFFLYPIDDNTDPSIIRHLHAADIMDDPYYAWIDTGWNWFLLPMLSWPIFFGIGFVISLLVGELSMEAMRIGWSVLVWGVFVRTVIAWHVTFSVNSFSHIWGGRAYNTPDNSRNNPVTGILAFGEGWHNNHHAYPRSARHGLAWWQFDMTWVLIRFMAGLKLLTINDRGPMAKAL
jgi:fatty-acid desaturase